MVVHWSVAHIKLGLQEKLFMGNLDSRRDWGYAKEYVEAMWLMLQQPEPDDYVIATNETHTIRECLEVAFGRVGLDWQKYVEIDPRYYRPAEVELLIGDASKAKRKMGWEPKDEVQRPHRADGRRRPRRPPALIPQGQVPPGFFCVPPRRGRSHLFTQKVP